MRLSSHLPPTVQALKLNRKIHRNNFSAHKNELMRQINATKSVNRNFRIFKKYFQQA